MTLDGVWFLGTAELAVLAARDVPEAHRCPPGRQLTIPPRPAAVPPRAGTAAVEAVVHLLATAIEEGQAPSSTSGILAGSSYRLLPA
jgi:hypothetical protein